MFQKYDELNFPISKTKSFHQFGPDGQSEFLRVQAWHLIDEVGVHSYRQGYMLRNITSNFVSKPWASFNKIDDPFEPFEPFSYEAVWTNACRIFR